MQNFEEMFQKIFVNRLHKLYIYRIINIIYYNIIITPLSQRRNRFRLIDTPRNSCILRPSVRYIVNWQFSHLSSLDAIESEKARDFFFFLSHSAYFMLPVIKFMYPYNDGRLKTCHHK